MSKNRGPSAAQLVEFTEVILPAHIRALQYVKKRRRERRRAEGTSKEVLRKIWRILEDWGFDDLILQDPAIVKTLDDEIDQLESVRRRLRSAIAAPKPAPTAYPHQYYPAPPGVQQFPAAPPATGTFTRAGDDADAKETAGIDWQSLLLLPPLSAAEIAGKLKKPVPNVDRVLRYYRKKYPACCSEDDNARRGEPRFRYKMEDVIPHLQKWMKKQQRNPANQQPVGD